MKVPPTSHFKPTILPDEEDDTTASQGISCTDAIKEIASIIFSSCCLPLSRKVGGSCCSNSRFPIGQPNLEEVRGYHRERVVKQSDVMLSPDIVAFLRRENAEEKERLFHALFGGDPNKTFFLGCSLLHLAVSKNNMSTIEFLLGKGADVNAVDCLGNTPLHTARSLEVVRLLVHHPDVNLNITNVMGENYLASIERYNPDLASQIREKVLGQ